MYTEEENERLLQRHFYHLALESGKTNAKKLIENVIKGLYAINHSMINLENAWEDICVQIQDEKTIHWEVYEYTIESVIKGEFESLQSILQDCIRLEVLDNYPHSIGSGMDGFNILTMDDIIVYFTREILEEAGKYTNSRIKTYIFGEEEEYNIENTPVNVSSTIKTSRFFSEKEAQELAVTLFTFWPKGIAMRWFYLAFQALEKSGLTYYENDREEMMVRERIVWLSVYYYEFCYQAAFHESPFFQPWEARMITEVKRDLGRDGRETKKVQEALNKYWGNERRLFAELWINCEEGGQNIVKRLEDSTYWHDGIVGEHLQLDYNKERGLNWVIRQECFLENYEAIAL